MNRGRSYFAARPCHLPWSGGQGCPKIGPMSRGWGECLASYTHGGKVGDVIKGPIGYMRTQFGYGCTHFGYDALRAVINGSNRLMHTSFRNYKQFSR